MGIRCVHQVALVVCIVLGAISCSRIPISRTKGTVNPLQFGLNEARTGAERYYVLQKTHNEAVRLGTGVSYAGIKEIELDIPSNAKSLPLTYYTDFAGVVLKVKNTQKDLYLYSLFDDLASVSVTGNEINRRDFSSNPTLKDGQKLLVIVDKTPWVENRIGYDYGATRKDIMLLKDGTSENGPVRSYSTPASNPECHYREVGVSKTIIKNIVFQRTAGSTKKTGLIKADNQYDLELSGISVTTPNDSNLYGDRAIYLINCYKVQLNDVNINGTYSLPKQFGYGVCLDNVYDFRANKMYARANWGVFGTNNVHNAHLTDCDINRFDIHCYGKDVRFDDCNFVDLYNQFASVYGVIEFHKCTFTGFKPIHAGSSYNAFTGYDIVFENCTFNLDKKHQSIMDFEGCHNIENPRPELKKKCLPNITMLNCQVNMLDDTKTWYVYNTTKLEKYEGSFYYISKVTLEGLSYNNNNLNMTVFSKSVKTDKKVQVVCD